MLALHFTPLRRGSDDLQALKQQIRALRLEGPCGVRSGTIAAIALGVPRLALCALAGALFGFVAGASLRWSRVSLGSYGAFLIARWSGRDWAERRLAGASDKLRAVLATPTITTIFVARQLPVPGILLNVLLGVLPTRHSHLPARHGAWLPAEHGHRGAGGQQPRQGEPGRRPSARCPLAMAGLGALAAGLMWLRKRGKD